MGCPTLPHLDEIERPNFLAVWKKSAGKENCENYYPFGLTFNSYSRENSTPNRWKFQSQEHIDDLGLNWDSFKWRNHQPDIGRFFNIDPLAAKYVYNSPYAFSENRVVNGRELEGLEVVLINSEGDKRTKESKEADKTIEKGASKTKGSDTMVTVTAHGSPRGMSNDKDGNKIRTAKQLDAMLNKFSDAWKNRKGNEGMTVVLYSCRTGEDVKDKEGKSVQKSFAQQMSGSKEFKDVEIIAPDERVYFKESGPMGAYKAENVGKDNNLIDGDKQSGENSGTPGNWNVFKNGELIRSYEGDWTPTNNAGWYDKTFKQN